ncbi:MAG: radical SAM protein [Candidatus Adiutrix sp.]|jgi:radical SAM protein with 4Fe4S-binding SPASM domain|nr:radical SAM protein [Candidatus Adiutrix sp.]
MIGISKLYCGTVEPSDVLRYGRNSRKLPSHLLQFSEDKKPVVVWNVTRACNLVCRHCYASATPGPAPDELSRAEALGLLDQLLSYQVPVVLFSGGEPLMHPHIFELMEKVARGGARVVLSTNGLLIDQATAARLKDLGLSYVGVSLDGLAEAHDRFRRLPGAFGRTLKAMEAARAAGLKVGLRFTLSRDNVADLPGIFDLIEKEAWPRICFYHLVGSGRGEEMGSAALSHQETRQAVDLIIERTQKLHQKGQPTEILTVDNHADGPYLYLKLKGEGRAGRAAQVLELLRLNGGNSSALGIGAISWNGLVHPDQFWRGLVLGDVRRRPFPEIWNDPDNPLLQALKHKKNHVTGRCRACSFLDICGGNLRARAVAAGGDLWAPDPACYLTDEEIATLAVP